MRGITKLKWGMQGVPVMKKKMYGHEKWKLGVSVPYVEITI
jgi:hypothetical protein